ncbi:hypothetical protein BDV93DRAFT_570088 [Ceratobasidium sp. AG-I]|nr:hypothetical protein BDV93DRAFT_570088 [Ceratobasidium sp. AG-I]
MGRDCSDRDWIDEKELPTRSDRNLESYYIQVPRISYLPLLLPDIRKHLTDLVLEGTAATTIKDEDWWFEDADSGALVKWHWPLELLYDHHLGARSLAVHRDPSRGMGWSTGLKPCAFPFP